MNSPNGSSTPSPDGSGRRSTKSCKADVSLLSLESESGSSLSIDRISLGMSLSLALRTNSARISPGMSSSAAKRMCHRYPRCSSVTAGRDGKRRGDARVDSMCRVAGYAYQWADAARHCSLPDKPSQEEKRVVVVRVLFDKRNCVFSEIWVRNPRQRTVVVRLAVILVPDQSLDYIGEDPLSFRQWQPGRVTLFHRDLGMALQYAGADFAIVEHQPRQHHAQARRNELVPVLLPEEQ